MDVKTLTIELAEEEMELFKQLLKKLDGRIISQGIIPNKETVEADDSNIKASLNMRISAINIMPAFSSKVICPNRSDARSAGVKRQSS